MSNTSAARSARGVTRRAPKSTPKTARSDSDSRAGEDEKERESEGEEKRQEKTRISTAVVLEGYIDRVGPHRVMGWVRNVEKADERCAVEVRLGDRLLGTITADCTRGDLKAAGIGDGCYAFEFPFEAPLEEADRKRISVRAFSADRSASVPLKRLNSMNLGNIALSSEMTSLKHALSNMAAHQVRAFERQSAALESLTLKLADLDRRIEDRRRLGAPETGDGDLEDRLGALEGMHLRFDQALQRLLQERETLLELDARRPKQGFRILVMSAVLLGLAVGLVAQWRFGLIAI